MFTYKWNVMPRSAGVKTKVERAAVDLFAANGFDGVSIADIAAMAGVSQGALYRHYPSKEELGWALFSTAYLRTGEELDRIRTGGAEFEAAVTAMIAHFCALYDEDSALFRFMLLTQHGFLPRIPSGSRTPVDAVVDLVGDAVTKDRPESAVEADRRDPRRPARARKGRLCGALGARAPALARASLAAVAALTQ